MMERCPFKIVSLAWDAWHIYIPLHVARFVWRVRVKILGEVKMFGELRRNENCVDARYFFSKFPTALSLRIKDASKKFKISSDSSLKKNYNKPSLIISRCYILKQKIPRFPKTFGIL